MAVLTTVYKLKRWNNYIIWFHKSLSILFGLGFLSLWLPILREGESIKFQCKHCYTLCRIATFTINTSYFTLFICTIITCFSHLHTNFTFIDVINSIDLFNDLECIRSTKYFLVDKLNVFIRGRQRDTILLNNFILTIFYSTGLYIKLQACNRVPPLCDFVLI